MLQLLAVLLGLHAGEAREATVEEDVVIQPQDAGTVSTACGTSFGTRFNLKPHTNAKPLQTTSVDFLRNWEAAGVDLIMGGAMDE